jgi:hypothetical protein
MHALGLRPGGRIGALPVSVQSVPVEASWFHTLNGDLIVASSVSLKRNKPLVRYQEM